MTEFTTTVPIDWKNVVLQYLRRESNHVVVLCNKRVDLESKFDELSKYLVNNTQMSITGSKVIGTLTVRNGGKVSFFCETNKHCMRGLIVNNAIFINTPMISKEFRELAFISTMKAT